MLHQGFYSIDSAVANSSGAMGAATISKNGRSTKSHTSRENFLGTVFFRSLVAPLVVSLGMVFSGCEKKTDDYSVEFPIYKWKLLSIASLGDEYQTQFVLDYAENNIIYAFHSNNVMTVSGNVEGIDYRGLIIGNHPYHVLSPSDAKKEGLGYGGYGSMYGGGYGVGYGVGYGSDYPNFVKISNIPYSFLIETDENGYARMRIVNVGEDVHVYSFLKVGSTDDREE
jgi:hypothetical protein